MTPTPRVQAILDRIGDTPSMGQLKAIAKETKKNHDLALELWSTGDYFPRLLSVLIMDKKLLTQEFIDGLVTDLGTHSSKESNRILEWLLANQLTKDKATVALMENWQKAESPMLRRLFWYYQARLRWTGQTPPENTADLVETIEKELASEHPDVQWAMNFAAGWIGVHDKPYRNRLLALGERVGLYADEVAPRGCTPNYLPGFIEVETAKLKK